MRRADETLFLPRGWFAIDAANRRVAGVSVTSLAAGLALVGHGCVATIVGRLRPGFLVVDVDVGGIEGDGVVEQLAAVCRTRAWWHLVKPSGGGPGRWHLVTAAPRDELTGVVDELRSRYGASTTQIDVRDTVRPLSAPHRTGAVTVPLGGRDALTAAVNALPGPDYSTGISAPRQDVLEPRPRSLQSLPAAWETYLTTGLKPAIEGSDRSESTFEAIAAGMLLRAGYTAITGWQRVVASHPAAMPRARHDRRRWIRLWNAAVRGDNNTRPPNPPLDPDVADAIAAAHDRLWAILRGDRARWTVQWVGLAVLARMTRTGRLQVPVPERDLVLDTGIKDRKTIRAALRILHQLDIGTLHTSTLRTGDAHTSYEFAIPTVGTGVHQNPPPSLHNPPAPATLGLQVSRPAAVAWRRLQGLSSTAAELTRRLGWTTLPHETPTARHIRSTRTLLEELAAVGYAKCDAAGVWRAVLPDSIDASVGVEHERITEQVQVERTEFRRARWNQWQAARRDALARTRLRQRTWWVNLDPGERRDRRDRAIERFAGLPCDEQARLKRVWASQRAGVTEGYRHTLWRASIDDTSYLARIEQRRRAYWARPAHERRQLAQAWQQHRDHFGVPRAMPPVPAAQLPLTA